MSERKILNRLLRRFRKSEERGRELIERSVAAGDYRFAHEVSQKNEMLAKVISAIKEEMQEP